MRQSLPPALLALLLVAGAILPEGAVLPTHGAPLLALGAALALVLLWGEKLPASSRMVRVGVALLGLWLAWQLLPIPPFLRAIFAPGQAAVMDRVAPEWPGNLTDWLGTVATYDLDAALDLRPTWTTDLLAGSLDHAWRPGAADSSGLPWTLTQLLSAPLFWLLGTRLGRSSTGTRVLFVGILLLGLMEAVLGLAWRNGPTTGLGVKTAYLGSATGTFVNRGHFAAFLNLSLGCAWGLAASMFPLLPEEVRRHAQRSKRSSQPPSVLAVAGDKIPRLVLLAFLVAVIAVGLVMSRSRGPLVGLLGAGLLVGGLIWRRRREPLHLSIAVIIPLAGIVLASVAFGLRGSLGRFWSVLWQDDSMLSRFAVWKAGIRAFLDAPIFGWGAAGWGLGWAGHVQGPMVYDFPLAHNELLQQLVEGGIVGFLGLSLILYSALRCVKKLGEEDVSPYAIGGMVGCGAVLLQSLVDFPLHIPGVLLPFCLLLGHAWGATQRVVEAPRGERAAWAGLAVATLACAALALHIDADYHGNRAARLSTMPPLYFRAAAEGADDVESWMPAATTALARSPLDPWLHLTVAYGEAVRTRGKAPEDHAYAADLALSRALYLRPQQPQLLVDAARVYLRLANQLVTRDAFRERATQALAKAVSLDGWRAEIAFKTAEKLPLSALERIRDAAPADPRTGARVYYEFALAVERRGLVEQALEAAARAGEINPDFGPTFFRAGEYARRLGRTEEATRHYRAFVDAREKPLAMEGWALYQLGDLEGANARFRKAVTETPDNRWAWEGVMVVAAKRGDDRGEKRAIEQIFRLGSENPKLRARLEELKGK